ncbi:MAG TPA: carboxypeptidase-like regulatory domain-containing protein [Vicinamibacterales bacterium]|nr:carboxypeptidase-like regulatory domain-containing protein [Vicinamibacterales bacterium]
MLSTLALAAALLLGPQQIRPPQQQQQTAPPEGTATIRGHVFAGDTGQPLRKAQVRIFAGEIRENRLATTDANGAYEFTGVRPGRYTISASKGSYVTTSYGQQRPTDAPKPLEILDRQTVERLDLSLPRGGVIAGRVVDEFGEPMSEISVAAQRYQYVQGRRTLVPTGRMSSTNDLGEFRVFGVPPGQYYLTATWRQTGINVNGQGNPQDRTAYPLTYFPGTTNAGEAQRITIAAGQDVNDVQMMLRPIKAARITGTAIGSDGKPMTPAMVLVSQTSGFGFTMMPGGQVKPDGTFTVTNVAPGEYTLRVQRMGPAAGEPEFASARLVVAGDDISDVHLIAAPPSVGTGRIIVDPAAAQQLPTPIVLTAFPTVFDGVPPPPPVRVADDLTFEIKSSPGRMRLSFGGFGQSPRGWTIKSVRVNATDVTDSGIEFKANENISGIEVELTNRLTSVSGLVTNGRGDQATDYAAVVFAQDKERWTPNSRYLATGRPDQDGRFKISGLPPGDYYIVAVDRLEPGQNGDPEFLDSVRSRAASFSLMDGETKTVDLKLTSAQP